MSSLTRPLALRFPLHGSRLIEASAGTGKTFTISALYLRLVLGHGGAEAGLGRELLPPEILVVTFTDAATRELRDRIRARLVQAAQAFREETVEIDPVLQGLLDDFAQADWPACARRLDIAAQWMDQAAVSTIHSWCQRMLREHAFDSGSLFTQTLETDHSELFAEVVRDYWREQCYRLFGAALAWVHANWEQPHRLAAEVRLLFQESLDVPRQSLQELIGPLIEQAQRQLQQIKAPWTNWADELEQWLDQLVEQGAVDKRKIQKRYYSPWCQALREWACDPELLAPELKTGFQRLTPEGMADVWKGAGAQEHPALSAIAGLPTALAALSSPLQPALRHAAGWIRQRFEAEKRRRAEMGFDDMLSRLDAALNGPNGERLADVIRRQFPLALIDEFQDTDPLQYRIFDRIYRVAENDRQYGLFLIGDPKQAIYAFRGADIHTYLKARAATEGRHDNLDTNFRSSGAMVEAVNRVFSIAENRPNSRGAFLFAADGHNPLPFIPVQAKGRREVWSESGQPLAALTVWQLDSEEPISGGQYQAEMAARCASEMVRLLNLGQQGEAGFVHSQNGLAPLRPADMAVLVRGFREAQAIRSELAARGVRSVYLSDKDSVYASAEAADVLRWLRACAEPDNDRLLRAALASPTLGQAWAVLDQLNQDERVWEQRVFQFRDYRGIWQRQGVLPMLHRLLHDFDLPSRLLGLEDGERRLTNLLHLAELLQQLARELDGEQALIRHLSERLADAADNTTEEQILRLESDAELVKVVTIHKSKGLEYPLVFLPFISAMRPIREDQPLRWHDGEQSHLVLAPDQDDVARADAERLAEDLRLLYVALTRARHGCWMGLADLKHGTRKESVLHRSAVGQLLGAGQPLSASAELAAWLAQWQAEGVIAVTPAPDISEERFVALQQQQMSLHARQPQRRASEHWWIASYSALRPGESTLPEVRAEDSAPDSPAAQKMADDDRRAVFVPLRSGEQADIHRFPRGPGPGTFLHGLLELAGIEGFANMSTAKGCLERLIPRCQRRGWGEWAEPLSQWLSKLIRRDWPLPLSSPLTLSSLIGGRYQVEMEFLFSAHQVSLRQLDAEVQAAVLPGLTRPELAAEQLNGLFKGYIDLVLEHQGRYYVVDYKSNWLGADDTAYSEAAMQAAVLEHRYDLQFVFYLLALHRQLKARLPDYDYDRHMGGALYWFIRGSQASNAGLWHQRPERGLIERLDRLFSGATDTEDSL